MSEVIYLIGAGASYGERNTDQYGHIIPGNIKRGMPVVNELETSINRYRKTIVEPDSFGAPSDISKFKYIYQELTWLEEMCKSYPTIDTYAKMLSVTGQARLLDRLKNALSIFFTLIQNHDTRDLRYDGFIAAIIQDLCELPTNVSILSWNYDYQIEYVLQDFYFEHSSILHTWQNRGISCKGCCSHIDAKKSNIIKLNGTAMFSQSRNHELINPDDCSIEVLEKYLSKEDKSWYSNISFAWEKDDKFIESILPIVYDAEVLVVIGYSFPYVNRFVDRKIIQNMDNLMSVYIQDVHPNDVRQSFDAVLSDNQKRQVRENQISIYQRDSLRQFIIPSELE